MHFVIITRKWRILKLYVILTYFLIYFFFFRFRVYFFTYISNTPRIYSECFPGRRFSTDKIRVETELSNHSLHFFPDLTINLPDIFRISSINYYAIFIDILINTKRYTNMKLLSKNCCKFVKIVADSSEVKLARKLTSWRQSYNSKEILITQHKTS